MVNRKSDDMVTKRHRSRNYPSPEYCILDMVNAHLKMNREGRKLTRGVLVCLGCHMIMNLLKLGYAFFSSLTGCYLGILLNNSGAINMQCKQGLIKKQLVIRTFILQFEENTSFLPLNEVKPKMSMLLTAILVQL